VSKLVIIGIDPGVTTGIAFGLFNPELRDRVGLWRALARGRRTGWAEVGPSKAGEAVMVRTTRGLAPITAKPNVGANSVMCGHVTARIVTDMINHFNMAWVGINEIEVWIESFQVRKNLVGATGFDKLAPVGVSFVVLHELLRQNLYQTVRFSQPSQSKALGSDQRLKAWGKLTRPADSMGWIRGARHARDACRQLAVGLQEAI
jgi:hypothetical protein